MSDAKQLKDDDTPNQFSGAPANVPMAGPTEEPLTPDQANTNNEQLKSKP